MRTLFALTVVLGLAVAQVPLLVCDAGPGHCLENALTGADHTCHAPLWHAGEAGSSACADAHDHSGSCSHRIVHVSLMGDSAEELAGSTPCVLLPPAPLSTVDDLSRDDAASVGERIALPPAPTSPCLRADRLLL